MALDMRTLINALVVLMLGLLTVPAASAHGPERLPLGDGKITDHPARGHVMSCKRWFWGGVGAHRLGEWIREGHWHPGEKPVVSGSVHWPAARLEIRREGDLRLIVANNLPDHATGEFPIAKGSTAYAYDRNPNPIRPQDVLLRLPIAPVPQFSPACVPMDVIGFMVSGAALFNALDEQGKDAPAHEIQDGCNGHPEVKGRYHYHNWSPCFADSDGVAGRHSSLVGWIVDGFPIFGPKGENGIPLSNADLDACHGHTHEVEIEGRRVNTYHYHFTAEYPYSVGCLVGRVPGQ